MSRVLLAVWLMTLGQCGGDSNKFNCVRKPEHPQTAVTPEPDLWSLLGLGLVALSGFLWHRAKPHD